MELKCRYFKMFIDHSLFRDHICMINENHSFNYTDIIFSHFKAATANREKKTRSP